MLKISKENLNGLYRKLSAAMPLYMPLKKAGEVNYGLWTEGAESSVETLKTVKSPKDLFFPQSETMMKFKTEGKSIEIVDVREEKKPFVLFGVRACDFKAFDVLDRVFLADPVDTYYQSRREAGVIVTLNTGRNLCESQMVLDRVPEIRYLMGCTGAFLMDVQQHERLSNHTLDIVTARQVNAIFRKYDTLIGIFYDDLVCNQADEIGQFTRFYPAEMKSVFDTHTVVPSLTATLAAREGGVDKFYVVFADAAAQQAALREIEPLPAFVTSAGFIDMEVMAQDANKGAILLELAERLHIRTDEILAIGDSENDVAMLQTAGVGVAMGNAKEHVREIADVVAPDNEHDGVAWTVERVLRGDFDGIG